MKMRKCTGKEREERREREEGRRDEWMEGGMEEWMDGWVDGWRKRRKERWKINENVLVFQLRYLFSLFGRVLDSFLFSSFALPESRHGRAPLSLR